MANIFLVIIVYSTVECHMKLNENLGLRSKLYS